MPPYRLSRLARLDLLEIADYTLDTWNLEQANRYLSGLEDCCKQLVSTPEIGRPCDQIRPGYRRLEREKHVIFYRLDGDSVFISRILHHRALPSERLIEDD